jgi:hypothetical protein
MLRALTLPLPVLPEPVDAAAEVSAALTDASEVDDAASVAAMGMTAAVVVAITSTSDAELTTDAVWGSTAGTSL